MIEKQMFDDMIKFAQKVPFNSLMYSEYEDLKDSICLINEENLKILYNTSGVYPIIEFASSGIEPLIEFLKINPIKGALHFVPSESVSIFESIGFTILGQYADFICNPLVDLNPDDSQRFTFASKKDIEELSKISQSCIGISRGFFGETKEWFSDWISENNVIVEKENDEITGFCCVSIYNNNTTLWIRELCVNPTHQKKGIGNKLVKNAITLGISKGAIKGFLAVDIENYSAIKIYEAYGFKQRDDSVETQLIR